MYDVSALRLSRAWRLDCMAAASGRLLMLKWFQLWLFLLLLLFLLRFSFLFLLLLQLPLLFLP